MIKISDNISNVFKNRKIQIPILKSLYILCSTYMLIKSTQDIITSEYIYFLHIIKIVKAINKI